jgi:hypothetical protein
MAISDAAGRAGKLTWDNPDVLSNAVKGGILPTKS